MYKSATGPLFASLIVRQPGWCVGIGVTVREVEQVLAPVGRGPSGRRVYSLAFRLEFLQAWDRCVEMGDKTRLLRAHALNRGTVVRWLKARERGEFEGSMVAAATAAYPESRRKVSEDRAELARLREENERLKAKVAQGEAVQDILGKAFELLEGINKSSTEAEPKIPPALMSVEQYKEYLTRRKLS